MLALFSKLFIPKLEACLNGSVGLSAGGQKHRIALARACYANADVLLLDDPLSAVDVHVGRHIMSDCITGILKGRTRILVTHQLQHLPEADLIIMMEGGRIVHTGTHSELMQRGVKFAQFHMDAPSETGEGEGDPQRSSSVSTNVHDDAADGAAAARKSTHGDEPAGPSKNRGTDVGLSANGVATGAGMVANGGQKGTMVGSLTRKEDRSKGSVRRSVYMTYLRSWGPALWMPLLFLGIAFFERGLQVPALTTQRFASLCPL
jgi:ABC-type Fe3+/spermidine/putrescine transport system ATPase subunit